MNSQEETCDLIISITDELRHAANIALTGPEIEDITEWKTLSLFAQSAISAENNRIHTVHEAQQLQRALGDLLFLTDRMEARHQRLAEARGGGRVEGGEEDRFPPDIKERIKYNIVSTAFKHRVHTACITNLIHKDVVTFLNDCFDMFKPKLHQLLQRFHALKINFVMHVAFIKPGHQHQDQPPAKHFKTRNEVLIQTMTDLEVDEWLQNVKSDFMRQIEAFETEESGWGMQSIENLMINLNKFEAVQASSFIPLPKAIKLKRATVNVKNTDECCFKYSVLAALYYKEKNSHHSNLPETYRNIDHGLDFNCVNFPTPLKDVPKFERVNNVSVNVFCLDKTKSKGKVTFDISPCHLTANKRDKHVNLLLIHEELDYTTDNDDSDNDDVTMTDLYNEARETPRKHHYVAIIDLGKLVNLQRSKNSHKVWVCDRCLNVFPLNNRDRDTVIAAHENDCGVMNKTAIKMPDEGSNVVKFTNICNQLRLPFIVYADLECYLEPVNANEEGDSRSNTFQTVRHIPFSIGFYVKSDLPDILPSGYQSYNGDEPMKWFMSKMVKLARRMSNARRDKITLQNTPEIQALHDSQTFCHICKKGFDISTSDKVKDHDHYTGTYRGAAHSSCNISYVKGKILPIVYHNLCYDIHFLIEDIAACDQLDSTHVIANTMEKYITVTRKLRKCDVSLKFIDSFRFLDSSLDKLGSYLPAFPLLRSEFSDLNEDTFQLLTRKGVFPYSYLDSREKLEETSLPPKDKFYNNLTLSDITDSDYNHALKVWQTFNLCTLGQYSDLYLKGDVMILADVFENFRSTCLTSYDLDPAHYTTLSSYTWDCMLKYTNVELELFTDVNMHLFIERGIRGGLCQCSLRHASANNPYMAEFDKSKPESYLMYYDVNNLYGWAMMQHLPKGNFQWVDADTNWSKQAAEDPSVGFILEVDLVYPENLHRRHNQLPFCPSTQVPPGGDKKTRKLLATLSNKSRYIIHFAALQQALQHGLELKATHRILKFEQRQWLKPYIDFNTKKRQAAKNDFEKNLFKKIVNSIFGKCIENKRRWIDVKLLRKWNGRRGAGRYVAKPLFQNISIFSENLVAVKVGKGSITLDKPVSVGFSILDLSKTCLYNFHYDIMTGKLFNPDNVSLAYTDTDSLIYHVNNVDVYKVMKDNPQYFDTSDYPENNVYQILRANGKVPSLMKDELSGRPMLEFIGLRPKLYSLKVSDGNVLKKCKGIKTSVVSKTIEFQDYLTCLKEDRVFYRTQQNFRSRLHKVETCTQTRIALSGYDNKRYILPCGVKTLAWGHKDIPFVNTEDDNENVDEDSNVLDIVVA